LIFHNGKLITHNDSGNTAQLFEIDTVSLQITRTVTISNAENIDWEDIAQDGDYIYIGDFGNNNGNRENLVVYRISKQDYDQSNNVSAERIEFVYEDQTSFSANAKSDWDAEALFVLNDQLVILTKQWQSNGTTAYAIPKIPGTFLARNLGSYAVGGLVTGATYNSQSNVLFIIGYTSFLGPFIVRFDNLTDTSIFGGTVERTSLNIGIAQVEGIAHVGVNTYFFSSEYFSNDAPLITSESRLFSFTTQDEAVEEGNPGENPEIENPEIENPDVEKEQLILYKTFGSSILGYDLQTKERIWGRAIFDTSGRRVHYVAGTDLEGDSIDLSALRSGVYYLTFYIGEGIMSKPFTRN